MDTAAYNQMASPSQSPVAVYASVQDGLFDQVLTKYMPDHSHMDMHMDMEK
jgi:hypothetical protein